MLGAIAGDVIGSVYERHNVKTKDFELFPAGSRFTDDSVLSLALAESLLTGEDYGAVMRRYHRRYPDAGYGPTFGAWIAAAPGDPAPRSHSNGAAMRISPVAWACGTLDEVRDAARRYTVITHDHPEAVRGAQASATAIFLARRGASKDEIRRHVEQMDGYDLSVPLDDVRPGYTFDVSCAGTVPHALRAFLEATDFEDALRNAISIGGDSDTLACIAGAVAEPYFGGVPDTIAARVWLVLDAPLVGLLRDFIAMYGGATPSRPA